MISKDKTRLQISITHDTAEALQLLAIGNDCTKSDVIEDVIIKVASGKIYYSGSDVMGILKRLHSDIINIVSDECMRKDSASCDGNCFNCERKSITEAFNKSLAKIK